MDTDKNIFKFSGCIKNISKDDLCKFTTDNLYSGSIDFNGTNSSYVFNFVNRTTLFYILDEVKNNKEVTIEIRSYAKDAERIQQADLARCDV